MIHRNRFIGATVALGLSVACQQAEPSGATPEPRPAASGESAQPLASPEGPLTLVTDRSLVCMVNDQFMGRPQIPVVVNGSTYFGCCPACKERLTKEPGTRTALDPGTRRPIDKARAVIAQTESGAARYFESKDSLLAYSRAAASN
jgi:hypothetical protein